MQTELRFLAIVVCIVIAPAGWWMHGRAMAQSPLPATQPAPARPDASPIAPEDFLPEDPSKALQPQDSVEISMTSTAPATADAKKRFQIASDGKVDFADLGIGGLSIGQATEAAQTAYAKAHPGTQAILTITKISTYFVNCAMPARSGAYETKEGGIPLFTALQMARADARRAGVLVIRRSADGKRNRILDISASDAAAENPDVNVMIRGGDIIRVLLPDDRLHRIDVIVTPTKFYMNGCNVTLEEIRAALAAISPEERKISFIAATASSRDFPSGRFLWAMQSLETITFELGLVKVSSAGTIPDIRVFYLGEKGEGRGGFDCRLVDEEFDTLSKIIQSANSPGNKSDYVTLIRGIYEGSDSRTLIDNATVGDVLANKHDDLKLQSGDVILFSKLKGATTRP